MASNDTIAIIASNLYAQTLQQAAQQHTDAVGRNAGMQRAIASAMMLLEMVEATAPASQIEEQPPHIDNGLPADAEPGRVR